jgi:hypothetical protein
MSLIRMTKVTRSTNYLQVGPRDMDAHSKLPYFLRVHGSVTPRMILPLTMVGGWATLITCICEFITPREQLPSYIWLLFLGKLLNYLKSVYPRFSSQFSVSSLVSPSPSALQRPTNGNLSPNPFIVLSNKNI